MTTFITIANQKGGVGKTTTAVILAHALALKGKSTLLVDTDPQGQVATFLGLARSSGLFDILVKNLALPAVVQPAQIDDTRRPKLTIVPGDKRTGSAQILAGVEGFNLACLAEVLADTDYEVILFDTSPSVGLFQEAALYASDWLIVPTAVDYAAAEGLGGMLNTMQAVTQKGGRCRLLGIVPTFYDDTTRESRAMLAQIKDRLKDAVWEPIHRATILRECVTAGRTIWELAPRSRAAREYAQIVFKVLPYV